MPTCPFNATDPTTRDDETMLLSATTASKQPKEHLALHTRPDQGTRTDLQHHENDDTGAETG